MANYDLAVGLDEATANRMAAVAWSKPGIRNGLFKGTKTISVTGINVAVTWDVQAAPQVSLSQPAAAIWNGSVGLDGKPAVTQPNSFLVSFPKLGIALNSAGALLIAADVICSVISAAGGHRTSALGVNTDLSKFSVTDQFIFKQVIIPELIKMAEAILTSQVLPAIDVDHVKFGPSVILVGNGRFVLAAALQGAPVPGVSPADFPADPFYILLSPQAVQVVGDQETTPLRGKVLPYSGSQSFGIGNANYSGSLTLRQVDFKAVNLPAIQLQIQPVAAASAGVNVLGSLEDIAKTVSGGVSDAAKTVGGGVSDVAKAVGGGVSDAAKAVGGGVSDAAKTVANAFKSY